jgi:hypothetical protein
MMKSKYDKLIDLLKYHDWFYDYSDDPRTYQWGHDNQINIERELDNLGRTKEAMMIYEDAMPENFYPDFAVVNDDGCMMTAWDLERKGTQTISETYTEDSQPKSNFIDSGSQHLPMSKPEDRF